MPTKEVCLVPPETHNTPGFFHYDVDQLVAEIKENLRLKSSKPSHSRNKSRASPYTVPSRTSDSKCDSCCSSRCGKPIRSLKKCLKHKTEDPYELLQELLREGSLIKEAVRRLQIGFTPKQTCYYDEPDSSDSLHCSEPRL